MKPSLKLKLKNEKSNESNLEYFDLESLFDKVKSTELLNLDIPINQSLDSNDIDTNDNLLKCKEQLEQRLLEYQKKIDFLEDESLKNMTAIHDKENNINLLSISNDELAKKLLTLREEYDKLKNDNKNIIKEKELKLSSINVSRNNINNYHKSKNLNIDYKPCLVFENSVELSHCLFLDKYYRHLLCYIECVNNISRPVIYKLENYELIQTLDICCEDSRVQYFRDDSKIEKYEYLTITNVNNSCHILVLDIVSEIFIKIKIISYNNFLFSSMIPNFLILYNHLYKNQEVYYIDEINEIKKIYDLPEIRYKYYNSYENSIFECSKNMVRLILVAKEKYSILNSYEIIPNDDKVINFAEVFIKNNEKFLYCNSFDKTHIFKYKSCVRIKTIGNDILYMATIFKSCLLKLRWNKNNNFFEFLLFDTDTDSTIKVMKVDGGSVGTRDLYYNNFKIIGNMKSHLFCENYISFHVPSKNRIHIHKFNFY